MAQADLLHLLSKDFGLLLIALLCVVRTCTAFNLDVRFPVIKEGKTEGSFFGLSVALHKQTEGETKYLLLTGAPKEKALPNLRANETGAIYACPMTTDPSDCSRIDLFNTVNANEIVDGMWLGVTVASQREEPAGRVLACGHRYIRVINPGSTEQWRMIGKCYVRGNDLSYNEQDLWQTFPYEDCDPNSDKDREGLCQMGISAGFTDTDVYIGSPGSYNWQGNVHVTWRNPNPEDSWDDNTKDFPDLKRKSYSYMGYSAAEEKKLLSVDESILVTGSPRDDNRGSVTLARMEYSALKTMLVLYGEQVGSYFGNSIAVTDLNSDGWNDLLVGAPFYFDRKEEKGGAVYIFMNENGSFQNQSSFVLFGFAGSAFGMSVAAIGDVNQDGFQDFAVGAPFHGSGKVYIWMGSQQGIPSKHSQVIEGKDVGKGGFHTFGYSINGGMDMDGNKYPDVLIGSLDNRIALLRARPVIHLNKSFTVKPNIVDANHCTDSCVTVKVCFSYSLSNGDKTFKKNITVKYTVEADADARRSSRLRFVENNQDSYTGFLSMPSTKCKELKLSLVEPVRNKVQPVVFSLNVSLYEETPKAQQALQNLDAFPVLYKEGDVLDKREIHFQKECGTDNKCHSNLQLTAEFVSEHQKPFPSQGEDQIMQYDSGVKKVMLVVKVTNLPASGKLAEDAHQAKVNITVPPSLHYSAVRSKDHVIDCEGDETLLCELGDPFKSKQTTIFQIIFETSGITLYTREIETTLQLSTLSEQSDLTPKSIVLMVEYKLQTTFTVTPLRIDSEFSGTVMGESAMTTANDVGSPVEYTFEVKVQGEPLGTMGSLELDFHWPLEVANGKWLLYLTEILMKGTKDSQCKPSGGIVNPLHLLLDSGGRRKREVGDPEPQESEPQPAVTLHTSPRDNILLDCELGGNVKCIHFSCLLQDMNNTAKVIVRARLWNSTMLEDYADDRVIVKGQATLNLVTDKPAIKMNSETREGSPHRFEYDYEYSEFVLNIDPKLTDKPLYQVPLWIIIVAVLAGVLLLGFIILLLWKCGFFRRANRREMYEAKAQKAEIKIQPSENERLSEEL